MPYQIDAFREVVIRRSGFRPRLVIALGSRATVARIAYGLLELTNREFAILADGEI
jgi:hypothetical protein